MNEEVPYRSGVIQPVECFKEAWALVKPHFWLLFAITVVAMAIAGVTLYLLGGAMICGIFICFLEAVDGREPKFDNLFKGLSFWKPSLLVLAAMVIPTLVVIGIVYVPLMISAVRGETMTQDELMTMLVGTFVVEMIFAIAMVCLHTLLIFAFPLIVDRRLGGWRSMVVSAKAVWHNLNGIAGLWAVGFFVALAGYLLLCVGIYLAIPIIIAANAVAFRKVFPVEGADSPSEAAAI